MDDAPGGQEDDGLGASAINLVIERYAVALDKSFLVRQFGTHGVTYPVDELPSAIRIRSPKRRNAWRTGNPFLLETEEIMAFCADKRVGQQGSDLLGRKRAETTELTFGPPRETSDEIEPPRDAGADHLGHRRIGPACGDQFLQNAHIAGGNVVIEIIARPVPLLREFECGVAEQRGLPIKQLRVEVFEERQHHPLLGAEVIVNLTERHAGCRGHVPR